MCKYAMHHHHQQPYMPKKERDKAAAAARDHEYAWGLVVNTQVASAYICVYVSGSLGITRGCEIKEAGLLFTCSFLP